MGQYQSLLRLLVGKFKGFPFPLTMVISLDSLSYRELHVAWSSQTFFCDIFHSDDFYPIWCLVLLLWEAMAASHCLFKTRVDSTGRIQRNKSTLINANLFKMALWDFSAQFLFHMFWKSHWIAPIYCKVLVGRKCHVRLFATSARVQFHL